MNEESVSLVISQKSCSGVTSITNTTTSLSCFAKNSDVCIVKVSVLFFSSQLETDLFAGIRILAEVKSYKHEEFLPYCEQNCTS